MKKGMLLLLILVLLCGCSRNGTPILDPVYFYYPRTEFTYGEEDGVISWEAIDGTGKLGDCAFLISQYFSGPLNDFFVNPFPEGTALLSADVEENHILLVLSDTASGLPEHWFSLGCSCLSMTCFNLFPADTVTVVSGSRSITTTRGSLLFLDNDMPQTRNGG